MAALSERERCLEIERDLNRILLSPNSKSSTPPSDAMVGLGAPFTFTALGVSSAAESDHVPRQLRQQQKPPTRRDRKRNPPPTRRDRRENQDAGGPEGPLLPTPSSTGPQADLPVSTLPKPDQKPRQDHQILVPSHRALNNSANMRKGTQRLTGNNGFPMMPRAHGPRPSRDVRFLNDLERHMREGSKALQGTPASFGSRNLKDPAHFAEGSSELEALKHFKVNSVLPLKKRSKRFPRAIFYCHLCHRHFDNKWYVDKHLEQEQHQLRLSVSQMRMDIKNLPHPAKVQVKAIDTKLQSLCCLGLSKESVKERKAFAEKLEASLREMVPDIKLTLHGSSVSGFGLTNTALDLDLSSTGRTEAAELLVELSDKITQDPYNFEEPKRDFLAKVPRLLFFDCASNCPCEISLNNSNSIKTSRLLADYASLDSRVQSLGFIFHYWAKVCKLDNQEKGSLPSHAYPIMAIYFLQQCKPPVVPVLHELMGGSDSEPHLSLKDSEWKWKSANKRSLGDLWCELLRFYAAEFRLEKHVVCIRRLKPVLISEKKWNKRYIAIEDPYSSKRNLARSIPSEEMNLFIKRALRESAIYFHRPQFFKGIDPRLYDTSAVPPLYTDNSEFESDSDSDQEEPKPKVADKELDGTKTTDDEEEEEDEDVDDASSCSSDAAPDTDEHDPDVPIADAVKAIVSMTLDDEGGSGHGSKTPFAKPHRRKEASTIAGASGFVPPGPPMTQQMIDSFSKMSENDFHYEFTLQTLTNGREPPTICTFCTRKGHLQENCPDQILPELVELPPVTRGHITILSNVCLDVMHECSPRPHEEKDRNMLLHELESLIRQLYPDAKLTLYGSSCNGFGLARSDLDICLTFASSKDGKELCPSKMIPELAKKLRAHPGLDRIVPITTAKVPIVKFYHRPSRLEGDISLYNTLAQHNTRLLKVYSAIDERVRVLGYTLKHFAKTCDIGDASRGSLSSYAYILMVLYYLQQCKPPVIPVLQELYPEGEKKPEVIIEGWNAWFFDDIDRLQSVWSEFGQNNESVGELWLGLLRFYTEEFNFRADVICIRQRKRITRLQKSWTSRCIAIEDPFELDHNLGSGVSRKMNTFIMKALIKGRALFGTPVRKPPTAYDSYIGYFFDRRQLVDGQPPNDRGCRLCSKIGHRVKDCPRRRGANNNGNQNDRAQGGGTLLERSRDYASGRVHAPLDNWRQPQDCAYRSQPYQRHPPEQQQQLQHQQQQQRKARPLQSHQGRNQGPEEPQHGATAESHLPGSSPPVQQLPSPAVAQAQLQRALQDMMRGGPYPLQWAPTGPPPFRGQAPTRPPPFPQGANGQLPPHPDVQVLMYRMRHEQQQQQELARNQHAQWRHHPPGPPRQHMEPHWAMQTPNPALNLASSPTVPSPGKPDPCLAASTMPNPAVHLPQQPGGILLTRNAPGSQLHPQFHCGPPPRAPFTAASHHVPLFPAYAPQGPTNREKAEQDAAYAPQGPMNRELAEQYSPHAPQGPTSREKAEEDAAYAPQGPINRESAEQYSPHAPQGLPNRKLAEQYSPYAPQSPPNGASAEQDEPASRNDV